MEGLFRPEVGLQETGVKGTRPLPRLPERLRWSAAVMAAAAVAVGSVLWLGSYGRKATLVGVLVPAGGWVRLMSPQSGLVVESKVKEGQSVRRGDVLFVLQPAQGALPDSAQAEVVRSLADRRTSLRESARLQGELLASRRAALERRLRALARERDQLDVETDAALRRLLLARESLVRQRALVEQKFISTAQLQLREEEVMAVEALQPALRRQRAALDREKAELEGELRALPLQSEQARSELARSQLQLTREALEQVPERQWVVRAMQDGVVGAVLVQAGQSVIEGSPLATLLPGDATLHLELLAPSSAVGLMRPAQTVRMRYEAFPYQRFGQHSAQLTEVSPAPMSATELAALPVPPVGPGSLPPGEALYRVTARLDADPGPPMPGGLRPGMRVQADVLLERRRWIEWVFAPALGVASSL